MELHMNPNQSYNGDDFYVIIETNVTRNNESIQCSSNENFAFSFFFHLACCIFLVSYLLPSCHWGHVSLHVGISIGHCVLGAWAWSLTCAPDIFFWHCGFAVINFIQVIIILYLMREDPLDTDMDRLYLDLFNPLKICRLEI